MYGSETEEHPFGYDWPARFPEHVQVQVGEGWAVFSAQGEGAWWLIFDEGTLADFLDPVDDSEVLASLVRLERFDDRDAWATAISELLLRRRPPTVRMVKHLRDD